MTIHKFEHLGIPDEIIQDDTKKLNESSRNTRERLAGIAFLALQSLDDRDGVSDKYIPAITALAERAVVTPLYKPGTTDDEIIQQCMITIEEYLKEQGV
jgi:hypothetical protein